ncbi:hypothetical protein VEx25_A1482 [Vibrio antiquarius]|uniref:Uncharacterized protein n=1 Tax=Vibrio antiquarius (strain Ex25) TaxID=150340 RepID=A0ABM9WZX5_VIBAE|nr:hypothetical protein VEx25_A1482 [Vibrio antiquarius]EMD80762.1 hypothetical protein C408_0821 [Vibrio diabolicus E0666]
MSTASVTVIDECSELRRKLGVKLTKEKQNFFVVMILISC